MTAPEGSIEAQAAQLVSPPLQVALRQRTQAGIEKYGQRLEANPQPLRARAVHLVQELLDGLQYALWMNEPAIATVLAIQADHITSAYQLTAQEIVEGGKQ